MDKQSNLKEKIWVTTRQWKEVGVKISSHQDVAEEGKDKINCWWYGQKYVEFLKEIGKRTGETSSDSDRMFLFSLLSAIKQLSPFRNRTEVQETFDENWNVLQLQNSSW